VTSTHRPPRPHLWLSSPLNMTGETRLATQLRAHFDPSVPLSINCSLLSVRCSYSVSLSILIRLCTDIISMIARLVKTAATRGHEEQRADPSYNFTYSVRGIYGAIPHTEYFVCL
jgi:hypothetical protein